MGTRLIVMISDPLGPNKQTSKQTKTKNNNNNNNKEEPKKSITKTFLDKCRTTQFSAPQTMLKHELSILLIGNALCTYTTQVIGEKYGHAGWWYSV